MYNIFVGVCSVQMKFLWYCLLAFTMSGTGFQRYKTGLKHGNIWLTVGLKFISRLKIFYEAYSPLHTCSIWAKELLLHGDLIRLGQNCSPFSLPYYIYK